MAIVRYPYRGIYMADVSAKPSKPLSPHPEDNP